MTFVFASNTGTMLGAKALRDRGIAARMLPLPAGARCTANLCLSVDEGAETRAIEAFKTAALSPTVLR